MRFQRVSQDSAALLPLLPLLLLVVVVVVVVEGEVGIIFSLGNIIADGSPMLLRRASPPE